MKKYFTDRKYKCVYNTIPIQIRKSDKLYRWENLHYYSNIILKLYMIFFLLISTISVLNKRSDLILKGVPN